MLHSKLKAQSLILKLLDECRVLGGEFGARAGERFRELPLGLQLPGEQTDFRMQRFVTGVPLRSRQRLDASDNIRVCAAVE